MTIARRLQFGFALLAWGRPTIAHAEAPEPPAVYLELATVDLPSGGIHARAVPSTQQSLWLSLNAYQLANYGMGALTGFEHRQGLGKFWPGAAIAATNVVMMIVPLGMAWEHERWHEAALSARGIDSTVNANKITGVTDESLAEFKRAHPAEFVRSQTVGVEGGYEFITTLEKEQFFRQTRVWNVPTIWSMYAMSSLYMQICASTLSDDDASYAAKETNQAKRDTGGSDCTGWTYDLFHPDEPYGARGPHPAGNGIRRYRTWSELTGREQGYLGQQRSLSFLNFLDPTLLGFSDFQMGRLRFNAHIRHVPTSFGHEIALDGFLEVDQLRLFVSAQNFFNYEHWFPGLSAQLWRYPFPVYGNRSLAVSMTLNGWLQPDDQRFFASMPELGGLARLRLDLSGPNTVEPFLEVDGKSRGWAAGVLALEASCSVRLGIGVPIY